VSFEQSFTAVLAMTALVGLFVLVQGLLARAGGIFPPGLVWVMVIYGIASVVGAIGFQLGGESHPLAMIGLLLTVIAGMIWVIWFGRLLLAEGVALVLVGSAS
jgi:predicted MFS family arabinose efflux permease